MCTKLLRRPFGLVNDNILTAFPSKKLTFATAANNQRICQSNLHSLKSCFIKRAITTSVRRRGISGQEPPSAQAYISSGILAGKKDLVDVRKVLVIGSGGLSIGQAGEFDYSGKLYLVFAIDIKGCVVVLGFLAFTDNIIEAD